MSRKASIDMGITERQQKILLYVAKRAIQAKLDQENIPSFDYPDEVFKQKRGAFVTLHKSGMLRGCIGYIEAIEPLLETVQKMAISAAFQDPRFSPLRKEEFSSLNLEISVLTPLEKLTDISEIEIGKHGLLIKRGLYQGLLLPQVATEQNWDVQEFLMNTCYKAGLPGDAYKRKGTEIWKFSAQIFSADVSEIEEP